MLNDVLGIFELHRDREFLVDTTSGRALTYDQVLVAAARAAQLLEREGLRPHDRVLLSLENSSTFVVLYFACLLLDVVAVPAHPTMSASELAYVRATSSARAAIYCAATKERVFEALADAPVTARISVEEIEDAFAASAKPDVARFARGGDRSASLFTIHFTSGTTGRPKGVAHRASSLFTNAKRFNDALRFDSSRRFVHLMPMGYMAGFLNTILCPFMAGAAVVLVPPFDAKSALRFWKPVVEHRGDTFWMTPTMLAALCRIDRDPAGAEYARRAVKTICVGTAPLARPLKLEFEAKYGVTVCESYGLSELLLLSYNAPHQEQRPSSVGKLLASVDVRIMADQEIEVRTPDVTAGYIDPETSQPKPLEAEWFPTGDIGVLDSDGYLSITGRKKDLIIRGGFNVSPRAVEDVLLEHPAVSETAVVGLPHDFYGEQVVATVKLKPGFAFATELPSLTQLCKARLGQTLWPDRYVERGEFPRAFNGKIQKNKLREELLRG